MAQVFQGLSAANGNWKVTSHFPSGGSQRRKSFLCASHSSIQRSGSWQAKGKEIIRNREERAEWFKVEVKGEGVQTNAGRRVEGGCWKYERRVKPK